MKKVLPFGSWPSAITTNLMVSSSIGLAEARLFNGHLYWLEFRPREKGRNVILRHDASGIHELISSEYNCRTQVHEYGGASYLPTDVGVFFVNQADQQIYRVAADGQVARITDAAQTLDACLGKGSVRFGPDVQQVVASLAGDIDQISNQCLSAFPIRVVRFETPSVVHGHAGLPINVDASGGDFLFRRAEVAGERTLF